MPSDEPVPSNAATPSWTELADFIQKQAKNDREVIDFWFKLAAGILGILLVILTLLGVKGYGDIQTISESTARNTATRISEKAAPVVAKLAAKQAASDEVRKIMEDPRIQKMVQDTAAQLFKDGAYRRAVQEAVREQMERAIQTEPIGDYDVAINGIPHQRIRIDKRLSSGAAK